MHGRRKTVDPIINSPKRGSYAFALYEQTQRDYSGGLDSISVKFSENFFYKRGIYYHFKEEDTKAIEDFHKAYDTDPKCIEALLGLSFLQLKNIETLQTVEPILKNVNACATFCEQNNKEDLRLLCQFAKVLLLLLSFKIRKVLEEINQILTQIEQGDLLHKIPHQILTEITYLSQSIQQFIFQGHKYMNELKNATSLLGSCTYHILTRFQLPPTLPEEDLRNWLVDMVLNNYTYSLYLKNPKLRENQQGKLSNMNFSDLIFQFLSFKQYDQYWWSFIVRWAIKNKKLSLTSLLLMNSHSKIIDNIWIINDIIEVSFATQFESGNWISILSSLKPLFKDKTLIQTSDFLRAISLNDYDLTNAILNLHPELINSKINEFYTINPLAKSKLSNNTMNSFSSGYSSEVSGSELSNDIHMSSENQLSEEFHKRYQKTILMYVIENSSCSIEILVLLSIQWLIHMNANIDDSNRNNNNSGSNNQTNGNAETKEQNTPSEVDIIIRFLNYLIDLDDDINTIHRISIFVGIVRRNPHWMDSNMDLYHRKICKILLKECLNWQRTINLKLITEIYEDFSAKDIISSFVLSELLEKFTIVDDQFDYTQWSNAEIVISWIINFVSCNLGLFSSNQRTHLMNYFREAYKFITLLYKKRGEFKGGDILNYRKYECIKMIELQLSSFFEYVCIEEIKKFHNNSSKEMNEKEKEKDKDKEKEANPNSNSTKANSSNSNGNNNNNSNNSLNGGNGVANNNGGGSNPLSAEINNPESNFDWRNIMETYILLLSSSQPSIQHQAENIKSNIQMKLQQLSSNNLKGPLRSDANFNKVIGFGLYTQSLLTSLDNKIIITKQLHPPYVKAEEYCKSVLREAKLLQGIYHSNIVRCIGYSNDQETGPQVYVEGVTDDLDSWLENLHSENLHLNEKEVVHILIDVAHALLFLQFNSITYKDLNPCHFLIGKNFRVKISDFGNWRLIPNQISMPSSYGSLHFISPEITARIGGVDQKSNVWSFGILIVKLITSKKMEHFAHEDLSSWLEKISQEEKLYIRRLVESIHDKKTVASFLSIRSHYIQLINSKMPVLTPLVSSCLEINPSKRPELHQILISLYQLYIQYYHVKSPLISQFKPNPQK